ERIEKMEDKIEGLGNGRVIIHRDFDQLETELEEARTQIARFQRKQMKHDDEIVLTRIKIYTIEILIEDIQLWRHMLLPWQMLTIPIGTPDKVKLLNCTKDNKVKFATGTLTEDALSWWNSFSQPIGIEEAYKTTCLTVKGNDLKTYIRRFQELAVLCPTMVPNAEKLMEVFIRGLP
ncbi:hypothetical protein Tco_1242311, partial [Tanacetum coccineum]